MNQITGKKVAAVVLCNTRNSGSGATVGLFSSVENAVGQASQDSDRRLRTLREVRYG